MREWYKRTHLVGWVWEGFPKEVTKLVYEYISGEYVLGH